jgi:hypothetical protein
MKMPPTQKQTQTDYIQTAVRMPRELHAEIQATAENNGRSMNAEIVARLQASPLDTVLDELADLKRMMRTLLDQS